MIEALTQELESEKSKTQTLEEQLVVYKVSRMSRCVTHSIIPTYMYDPQISVAY